MTDVFTCPVAAMAIRLQHYAIAALVVGISLQVLRLCRHNVIKRAYAFGPAVALAHGLIFTIVVVVRTSGNYTPTPFMTFWSGLWRIHVLVTIAAILEAIWRERSRNGMD